MCGIVAWVDNSNQSNEQRHATVLSMRDAMAHRGADDAGLEVIDNVILAQRRLSILDLSPLGHQPMSIASEHSIDGRLWITFNGEIYNFLAIRSKLEQQGVSFNSNTDTEVLLHAYRTNPTHFLDDLEGMFAFVIYDAKAKQLIMARDRFGEKPFYYSHIVGKHFGAASEIKALTENPDVSRAWSTEGIALFEQMGFIPAPYSAFETIQTLPAAHWAILNTETLDWVQPPTAYWTLPSSSDCVAVEIDGITNGQSFEPEQLAQTFETMLGDSVRLRRVADVPLGVLLSGGLDSSTIATLTQEQARNEGLEPINTFTVKFDAPVLDESGKAQLVANKLQSQHHVVVCTAENFWQTAQQLLPTLDSLNVEHLVPMALVAQLAKEHVTVVLSGDGADEALGGYNGYRSVETLQGLEKWGASGWMPHLTEGLLKLPLPAERKRQWHRVKQYYRAPSGYGYAAYRYANTLAHIGNTLGQPLFETNSPFGETSDMWSVLNSPPITTWNDALRFDCETNMAQSILMKSDTMTMQYGLELRCPFLDSRLFSWLYSLPVAVKRKHGLSKSLLRQFLQQRSFPESIWNQKKAGFIAPFGYWMRTLPWFANAVEDTILSQSSDATLGLRPEAISALMKQHQQGNTDHSHSLWALVIFSAWAKYYGQPSKESHQVSLTKQSNLTVGITQ